MPDDTTTQAVNSIQAVDGATTTGTNATVQDTIVEPDSVDKLPKWAQRVISDLRSENAKHRTEKTAVEKAAQDAATAAAAEQGKFKELYEAELAKTQVVEAKLKAAEISGIRARIGSKLQLPSELLDRLRGETEEDIEADAKVLLAAIPKPQAVTTTDASTGTNTSPPTSVKSDEDIREEAARLGVNFDNLKSYYLSRVKK